jgi:anaphase-promoting complex subunit 4
MLLYSATDIFAFQGSQIRPTPRVSVPEVIRSWPILFSDPLAASINPPPQSQTQSNNPGTAPDDTDDSNVNSILTVADDLGRIHCFLDGTYPLGVIPFGSEVSISSLFKDPQQLLFYAHPQAHFKDAVVTDLQPTTINVPLLERGDIRAMAKLSSTARELLWYIIRVVKEMRYVWFGFGTYTGARELGPKWTRALEAKQKEQFGRVFTFFIYLLTCLTHVYTRGRPKPNLRTDKPVGHRANFRGSPGFSG